MFAARTRLLEIAAMRDFPLAFERVPMSDLVLGNEITK